MILHVHTIIHTLISLVAIFTGFVVLLGFLGSKRFDSWTKWFLITAGATTVTGFFFPSHGFTPAIGLGIVTIPVLVVTIYARYAKHLAGVWRWIFVVGALLLLYLNVFVGIVQSFQKIPALKAIAPTQTEPPVQVTQLIALALFIGLTAVGVVRFRIAPARSAVIAG